MESYYLQNSVHIRKNTIYLNKIEVFSASSDLQLNEFLKQAYQFLQISYPKFHKMDAMSKLGILATQVLFQTAPSSKTALVFSNNSGSLEIDKIHLENMNFLPSPAVFVYTLPNIVMGEISIKFHLQSENAFFMEKEFNAGLLKNYTNILLNTKKADSVVCGWIDLENGEYDVFLSLISSSGSKIFSEENLKQTYIF